MFKQTFLFFLSFFFFPTLPLIFKLDFKKLGMEVMFILASSDSVKVIVVRSKVAPLSPPAPPPPPRLGWPRYGLTGADLVPEAGWDSWVGWGNRVLCGSLAFWPVGSLCQKA